SLAHRVHRCAPRGPRRDDAPDPPRAGHRVGGTGDAPEESTRPCDGEKAEGVSREGPSASGAASRVAARDPGGPLMAALIDTFYGTGRRKTSVARVWVRPGSGRMMVNRRSFENYFPRETLRMIIAQPFQVTNTSGQFDMIATVAGGGP